MPLPSVSNPGLSSIWGSSCLIFHENTGDFKWEESWCRRNIQNGNNYHARNSVTASKLVQAFEIFLISVFCGYFAKKISSAGRETIARLQFKGCLSWPRELDWTNRSFSLSFGGVRKWLWSSVIMAPVLSYRQNIRKRWSFKHCPIHWTLAKARDCLKHWAKRQSQTPSDWDLFWKAQFEDGDFIFTKAFAPAVWRMD